jgi:rhodanese-related sulfurtransferase
MSSKPSSTIGFERRYNEMLTLETLDEFVSASTGSAGLRPANVERIVELNRGPFVAAPPAVGPARADGATVLDVRAAEEFASGHVPGAFNVPLSASRFGVRCGFLLAPEERIVLHAGSREHAELAARRLQAVGFFELAGYLEDPETPARLEPVGLDELERLLAEDAAQVIDVREADERDGSYIPGSRHISYRLLRALADGIDGGDRPVVTICESGTRAAIAASVLAAKGIDARPVLEGGIAAWQALGHETVAFRRCGT